MIILTGETLNQLQPVDQSPMLPPGVSLCTSSSCMAIDYVPGQSPEPQIPTIYIPPAPSPMTDTPAPMSTPALPAANVPVESVTMMTTDPAVSGLLNAYQSAFGSPTTSSGAGGVVVTPVQAPDQSTTSSTGPSIGTFLFLGLIALVAFVIYRWWKKRRGTAP